MQGGKGEEFEGEVCRERVYYVPQREVKIRPAIPSPTANSERTDIKASSQATRTGVDRDGVGGTCSEWSDEGGRPRLGEICGGG